MKLKDILAPIQTLAPIISTALTGTPMFGLALRSLSEAVLGRPDGTEEEIAKIISTADPAIYQKIKEAEHRFKLDIKELEVEQDRLIVEDTKDARNMNRVTRDWAPVILACFSFAGFFGILLALIFVTIPSSSEAPLNIMLGSLGTMVLLIVKFYFGSSKSSAEKNATINTFLSRK